jgi:hypothetical protein
MAIETAGCKSFPSSTVLLKLIKLPYGVHDGARQVFMTHVNTKELRLALSPGNRFHYNTPL